MVLVKMWGGVVGVLVGGASEMAAVTAYTIWNATIVIPLSFLWIFFLVILDKGQKFSEQEVSSCFSIRRADMWVWQGQGVASPTFSALLVSAHSLQRLVLMFWPRFVLNWPRRVRVGMDIVVTGAEFEGRVGATILWIVGGGLFLLSGGGAFSQFRRRLGAVGAKRAAA